MVQEYLKSLMADGETGQVEDWETNSESDCSVDEYRCGLFYMPDKVNELQVA